MTTSQTAEIVTFKLASGAQEEAFMASMQASNSYISGCAGYVSRQLSRAEDGTWTDYVIWDNPDAAKAAAEGFMAHVWAQDIVAAIDKSTFSMRHQAILWQPA